MMEKLAQIFVEIKYFCFKTGKNYYPQVFLEECKYVVKEKEMHKYITDDVETSSDDSDKEESSGKENSDEENYGEE